MLIGWTHLGVGPGGFITVAEQGKRALEAAGHKVVRWEPGTDCDVIIAHQEVWWSQEEFARYDKPWAPILLLDHAPLSPYILRSLDGASLVLCPTRFALDAVKTLLPEKPVVYVPHAYDKRIFYPRRDSAPQRVLPRHADSPLQVANDAVVVGCVKANSGFRPNYGALMEAFCISVDELHLSPSQAVLYIHADPSGRGVVRGYDLWAAAERFGVKEYVHFGPQGAKPEVLADMYRSMDVHVVPSVGEGFGLTTLESQACGVPTLATDWAGGAEIVPPWCRIPVAARMLNPHMGDQALVSADDLVPMLHRVLQDRRDRESWGRQAAAHVAEYEVGVVAKHWEVAAAGLEAARG